ncbi:EpsG family protein [Vibrio fluvialis]|nr:EpsG family protein [Vibrio fluvialis]
MIVYNFAVIASLSVLFISYINNSRVLNKFLYIFLVIVLIVISGFRYRIGSDYDTYIELFNVAKLNYIPGEPIFSIFSYVSSCISDSYGQYFLFFFYASMTLFLIGVFYVKHSDDKLLSLSIFLILPILFLSSMNVVRQFLAVGFFAYSIRYIQSRELFKYCLCIMLATAAHKSAIVLLPLYYFLPLKFSAMMYLSIASVFFMSLKLLPYIISLSGFSLIYLELYKSDGINVMSILMFGFFVVYFFCVKMYGTKGKGNDALHLNMVFISVIISLSPLFSELAGSVFVRLSSYFTFCLPIVIVRLKMYLKGSEIKFLYQASILLVLLLYFYLVLLSKGEELRLVPYNCVFC